MLQFVLFFILMPLLRNSYALDITGEQYASMPLVFEIEHYDNCMLMGEKAVYCYIKFQLSPLHSKNTSKTWELIEEASSSPLRYRHDLLRHCICIPKTCPEVTVPHTSTAEFNAEISKCYSKKFLKDGLQGTVLESTCLTSKPTYIIDTFDYIAAAGFSGYIIFILLVSFYDFNQRSKSVDTYKQFKNTSWGWLITSFSVPSNWEKLKSIPTGGDFDRLKSVQGIRVFMTIMVIGVHTCLTFAALPVTNTLWLEESNENPDFLTEIPRRGIFLLSFHFMTSSWILMNSLLAKVDKNEDIRLGFIIKSIIKRYIRFLPSVAVVVGFYATWLRHIPFGPMGIGVCEESERCRQNWWTNILFIQNHVNRYYMCHIISWYLAVEMQYYILSLFLIKGLVKIRNKIPIVLSFLLVVNILLVYLDHYRHGYPSTLSGTPEEVFELTFNKKPQWHDHFASYHGNFAGSLTGMIFGYYFYKYKNEKLFNSKASNLMWWLVSFGLLNTVLHLPAIINVDKTPTHSAAWVAVTRPIFSIGMGLLVLGISHGLGSFVKWICEWNPLQGLAKLSYCVYISHTVLQNIRVGLSRDLVFLNYYVFVTAVASDVLLSFLVAVPFTLLFEMPANEIANALFRIKRTGEKKKD